MEINLTEVMENEKKTDTSNNNNKIKPVTK